MYRLVSIDRIIVMEKFDYLTIILFFAMAVIAILFLALVFLFIKYKRLKLHNSVSSCQDYLLNSAPVALLFKDLKGNVIFTNKKFLEITGYTRAEVRNKSTKEIFQTVHFTEAVEAEAKIVETNSCWRREGFVRFKDSEPHYYEFLKAPVFTSGNELIGFIIIFENADDKKEMADGKENFIATLTHDLKSPTYAQINILNMFINGEFGAITPEQTEMLSLVRCSCKYVSNLVATVLDTYRCENGKIKLNNTKFDLMILVSALCKGFTSISQEKNQTVILHSDREQCFVYADRLQLKRVIYNLLSNAVNYGFKGSEIVINLVSAGGKVELSVENISQPIPDVELKNMFERFKQTKNSRYNQVSTGLGLYLAKQIIEMHSGHIFARSNLDGKCTFGFEIPDALENAPKNCEIIDCDCPDMQAEFMN